MDHTLWLYLNRLMTKSTKWLCTKRRLRSAWASAQSDQRLRCPHENNLGSLATHLAHSKDSDQTGRMPRLIWVFAGRTVILLILSRGGSFWFFKAGIQTTTSGLNFCVTAVKTSLFFVNEFGDIFKKCKLIIPFTSRYNKYMMEPINWVFFSIIIIISLFTEDDILS